MAGINLSVDSRNNTRFNLVCKQGSSCLHDPSPAYPFDAQQSCTQRNINQFCNMKQTKRIFVELNSDTKCFLIVALVRYRHHCNCRSHWPCQHHPHEILTSTIHSSPVIQHTTCSPTPKTRAHGVMHPCTHVLLLKYNTETRGGCTCAIIQAK